MPTVPQFEPGQVRERPRYQQGISVSAGPASFGLGAAQGLADVAQGVSALGTALQQVEDLKATANTKDGEVELRDWNRNARYGEGGYMTLQGQAAIDGRAQYEKNLRAKADEIGGRLSPLAQKKWKPVSDNIIDSSLDQAIVHSATETKKYVSDASAARLNSLSEDALADYQNPLIVDHNIQQGRDEIARQSKLEGWAPEKLKNAEDEYVSGVHKSIALRMAQTDPVAARSYAERNKKALTGPARADLDQIFAPLIVDENAKRNTAKFFDGVKSGKIPSNQFAAKDLPQGAYGLLGVIAGSESPDYRTINGGKKFDSYDDHPREKGTGSTAAGRYQFVAGTWDRVANVLGLPNFTPEMQDRGAWWLAQADYKSRTGRDLEGDLSAGRYSQVRAGLSSTWEGLAKMSDAQFAAKMSGASGVAVSADPTAFLDGISNPDERTATSQRITTMLAMQKRQQETEMTALKSQAFGLIDSGQSPDSIPAEVRARLGRDEMTGLWSYYDGRSKRGQPETDDRTLYDLQQMYASDPESFSQIDLFKYRDRLDDTAWKEVTGWRQTALTDTRKAKDDGATITAAFSQADTQLDALGITTDGVRDAGAREAAAQRRANFNMQLAAQVQAFKESEKKNPTQIEVQQMINKLLLPVVVSRPGMMWGTNEDSAKPLFEVGGVGDLGGGQIAKVRMDYEKIPPNDRVDVEIALERRLGRKPSETEVEQEYAAILADAYGVKP